MPRERIGPTSSSDFVVSKVPDGLEVNFLGWIVWQDFVEFVLPVALIERPKTVTQAIHYGFDEGLVWVVIEQCLKSVNIKGSLHTNESSHFSES